MICRGRLKGGGQQSTQLQDKLFKGATPALSVDPAALGQADNCYFRPLFSLPVNVCPSSGAPWQTQELQRHR